MVRERSRHRRPAGRGCAPADGINFARPGKRKLAFYPEKPLGKVLGDAVATPPLAEPMATLARRAIAGCVAAFARRRTAAVEEPEVVIGLSDFGPIDPERPIMLRSPALDGGIELLGGRRSRDPPRCAHSRRKAGDRRLGPGCRGRARRRLFLGFAGRCRTALATAIRPPEPTIGKGEPSFLPCLRRRSAPRQPRRRRLRR